ncbi:MAG: hypothetical protein KDK78_10745 [Chlamydiia bacterium]|nr:hypothetical protein [Chlamydiia bacterium]
MSKTIYQRLADYYAQVATVLRGEAKASSVFPNTTDVGLSREGIIAHLLRSHLPSKCNVFLGGFVFDESGNESKQLDIVVNTDTTPRFKPVHDSDKSFSPVEGTLGIISVKSTLDKKELVDALDGIASIPPMVDLAGRATFGITIKDYDDWPYKVVYASDCIQPRTLETHLNDYYLNNVDVPLTRRPDLIYCSGRCAIIRWKDGMKVATGDQSDGSQHKVGEYVCMTNLPDLHGILWLLRSLQEKATASAHIIYTYGHILDKTLYEANRTARS